MGSCRENIRNTILAMLRPNKLEKIANIWIGEEGWGKVYLSILGIEKLNQTGNVRCINGLTGNLQEDLTEIKKKS